MDEYKAITLCSHARSHFLVLYSLYVIEGTTALQLLCLIYDYNRIF